MCGWFPRQRDAGSGEHSGSPDASRKVHETLPPNRNGKRDTVLFLPISKHQDLPTLQQTGTKKQGNTIDHGMMLNITPEKHDTNGHPRLQYGSVDRASTGTLMYVLQNGFRVYSRTETLR